MKIAIGNDHAGPALKKELVSFLESEGHQVINFGTDSYDSVDYPDFAKTVSNAILKSEADLGILICGTGIGISMAANKISGIRAAIVTNELCARLARQHNNANIIALGARVIGPDLAKSCVKEFLNAEFEGGRHARRVEKLEGCGCE
ncbi:ribose 5-phosphate isomerase B [Caviibacter abscessus]|uniref:ribose 5-phosphate isomerase B n=1 Tax=Caviibacter abscessus TaxID=1766719 RepID=UPI0008329894|nr:ribose 5-phosphate isomerase B [Caviibacter abscessus]